MSFLLTASLIDRPLSRSSSDILTSNSHHHQTKVYDSGFWSVICFASVMFERALMLQLNLMFLSIRSRGFSTTAVSGQTKRMLLFHKKKGLSLYGHMTYGANVTVSICCTNYKCFIFFGEHFQNLRGNVYFSVRLCITCYILIERRC